MTLILPYPSLGTGVVDPTAIEDNFSEIAAKFGSFTSADFAASAGITNTQLASPYQMMVVQLSARGALSATGIADLAPMYNDTYGAWTVTAVNWASTDIGGETGKFKVEYGSYEADGVWAAALSTAETTITSGAANNTGAEGECTLSTLSSITLVTHNPTSTYVRSLALNITTADANATNLFITVTLKRQIRAI